jgi:hypothetical protein
MAPRLTKGDVKISSRLNLIDQEKIFMTRRLSLSALVAVVLAAAPQLLAQKPPAAAPKKNPLLKLAEPFPEDDVMTQRKADATARKLFQEETPVEFTLTSEFSLLNKERTPNNNKQFPGVITINGKDLNVKLSSRGHLRLNPRTCSFVPIKVTFAKDELAGTVFEGQSDLKLGTHCQNEKEFDQYVMREYLTYKLANLVTPFSFRARLARATYVDAKSKKQVAVHNAVWLEHENDVAKRLSGRDVSLPRIEFKDLDKDSTTMMMLLEYMLGNTDYSIWALHNVVIVQDKKRTLYPVAYDFDMSGMVHPPYAIPDARLRLRAVTDRLYRGPCRTVDEFNAVAEQFRSKKADMVGAVDSMKELSGSHKSEMKDYLESFFRTIDKPESIKKNFVDGCKPLPTM